NQLRMIEDATIIYKVSRAPERRIFYIDVGNLPKGVYITSVYTTKGNIKNEKLIVY
ncbi:MAG: portal protein, partial [Bacteroidetes bacterium]|nr:portal protein [Bacteroidota bacterium]